MKTFRIIIACGAALMALAACHSKGGDMVAESASAEVKEVASTPAYSVIKPDGQIPPADGKLIVLDFSASWCGPCRQFAPNFEAVARKLGSQASFYKIDVDENPRLAAMYNVQSIPTVVYIKPDGTTSQSLGYMDSAEFESAVKARL